MATIRKNRITEGSCWPCRRRRIRCDLAKPVCSRCSSNAQKCEYGPVAPIKWVGGMALRGRQAPTQQTLENHLHQEPHKQVMLAPPATPPLDTECLVLYFTNAVLPRFQLMEEALPLDLPAIMQDVPLQQAILAVSQAHHDRFSHETSSDSALCRKKSRHSAIQSLRRQLENGIDSSTTAQQLFTVNVLLCILDGMIEPPEDQSNASLFHLKGGYAMLDNWHETPGSMLKEGGLQAHLLSVFATMDLVHCLLSGDKPFFEPLIWPMFADIQAWWGRLPCSDRFLTLLKIFSEMASLGHLVASHLPSRSRDGLMPVEKCIPSIELTLNGQAGLDIQCGQHSPLLSGPWHTFCSLYEISGTIYLHRALRGLSVDDELVQTATRRGVEKLLDEALPNMMAHCVILPILIIGAQCIHSQDRRAITEALSPSLSYLSFGNLQLMNDLLKQIWSRTDTQATWWDSFQAVSEKVFLF